MEAGYNVGNLQELDARFKCTHCQLLLRDPMQGDCGHRYCKNCIANKHNEALAANQQSLCVACDDDDQTVISPDRTYPDPAIRREINKTLQVQCSNDQCEEKMLLKELEQHLLQCKYRPVPCPSCQQQVAHCLLDSHREAECPKRLVECEKCGEPVPLDEMESHLAKTCVGSTRQCQYCLHRVKDNEEEMDKHLLAECPVGWHADKDCPFGCPSMPEGWEQHRQQCVHLHVDRLLERVAQPGASVAAQLAGARPKQQQQQQQQQQQPESQQEKQKKQLQLQSDSVGQPDTVVAPLMSEMPGLGDAEVEILHELDARSKRLEVETRRLPLEALASDANAAILEKMADALGNSRELGSVLDLVQKQFEECHEQLRHYEKKMQKELEKKLEIEKKNQELIKLMAYKEVKIQELERRVEILEHASYDGILVWKITDVTRRKEEAKEGKVCSIYSPPFYTGKAGYKMCGRLYLNGDGAGKSSHISLFFVIMRGQFDALLPWPFSKKVSMMLLDQNFEEHVIDAFKPDTNSSSFKRPTTEMNIASGCPLFMPIADFENTSKGYVKDNTMFIKFIVDKSDLPS